MVLLMVDWGGGKFYFLKMIVYHLSFRAINGTVIQRAIKVQEKLYVVTWSGDFGGIYYEELNVVDLTNYSSYN